MSKNTNSMSVLIYSIFTLITCITLSNSVSANTRPWSDALGLIESACPTGAEQNQELNHLQKTIASAKSLTQAQAIALVPTNEAIDALKNARSIMPFSDDLLIAETRLSDARTRILVASSQEQVADEFSGMMLAGLDDDSAVHASAGSTSCNYSSGEVIAIVVGLILGIIPGLILLFVLC
ncbi:MAG: hypothetical protein KGZ88_06855 [Methylomicrobium sp.]|nr:hypothetical protein [Methylomicrobium sp.]